jgi:formate dehydrogenase major subunit
MAALDGKERIKVTVNDREMEVYSGLTILQALLQEGVHVPHLCYDIRVERSNGNCGLCVVELGPDGREVKACQTPIRPGMEIRTGGARLEGYRKIRLEQLLSDHNADCVAPCVTTCPANIDIQSYLRQVGNGNYEAAVKIIKDRNPFPSVCGRVCPHPCEAACRRNLVDTPVAINHVKRFAADWDMARATPWMPKKADPTGRKIAVVGAGPSGLSAAYYSALNGHAVTVFERQPAAGGMMRYGIPAYRLPRATLDREIGLIESLGVRLVTGKALGTHLRLEDLQRDFDAVYLALGSWLATPLQIEG